MLHIIVSVEKNALTCASKGENKIFLYSEKTKGRNHFVKNRFSQERAKNYLGISEVYFNSDGYRNGKRLLKGEAEAPTSGFKELGFRWRRRRGEKSDEER